MGNTGISVIAHGTILANGAEQDLLDSIVASQFTGWLDLTNMLAGDTLVVKQYEYIEGAKILYKSVSCSGAQAEPALYITPKTSASRIVVSIQQTLGVNRNYKYEFAKVSEQGAEFEI